MNLSTQKRIAAEIMKCGVSRIRIKEDKDVEEALTREDIRNLIKKGLIKRIQKKGTSRVHARAILRQKKRGRRRGAGSKKGKAHVGKTGWMSIVRAQRAMLKEMRESGSIKSREYRILYGRVKGGMFRNKKHLLSYMKEHDILKVKK